MQYYLCPYKTRQFGHLKQTPAHARTEKQSCEKTARRQPSISEEERTHRKPVLLAL